MSKETNDYKFKRIVKETFHSKLKPLGFKKKGNNFYKVFERFGHFVNFQRSVYNSYFETSFTVNINIFSHDYYKGYYIRDFPGRTEIPEFPSETECIFSFRIGKFIDGKDKWYVINDDTDETQIITEINDLIVGEIIPWFSERENFESIYEMINSGNDHDKVIFYRK